MKEIVYSWLEKHISYPLYEHLLDQITVALWYRKIVNQNLSYLRHFSNVSLLKSGS